MWGGGARPGDSTNPGVVENVIVREEDDPMGNGCRVSLASPVLLGLTDDPAT